MKTRKLRIPKFENEDQEREFWATHSPLDYFDTSRPIRGSFPNLKPSLKSVSIRLPEDLLLELKNLANKRDVPYQSLMKIFLARQVALERQSPLTVSEKRKKYTAKRSRLASQSAKLEPGAEKAMANEEVIEDTKEWEKY